MVTVENLIQWSAPIDTIERYQQFLSTNNSLLIDYFYNCTIPWFGPYCQYKFPLNETFAKIVETIFNTRGRSPYDNSTCYIYMKCNRGSSLLCLDWREICDGKIDCLDGGEDEQNCLELYMNKCGENEYQCRNGMCIDKVFLMDSDWFEEPARECLDQSDESIERVPDFRCQNTPQFLCENVFTAFPSTFPCGDGTHTLLSLPLYRHECYNGRDRVFSYTVQWNRLMNNPYSHCFKMACCASNIFSANDFELYCKNLCNNVEKCEIDLKFCPSYVFMPDFPMWDGQVLLGFFLNRTIIFEYNFIKPHFICFDQHKCPFLTPTFNLNNYTCMNVDIPDVIRAINFFQLFIPCTNAYHDINLSTYSPSSIFQCTGTNKSIPHRYVMDGILDCYNKSDESVAANSCALNDKYRFQCASENKCLRPTLVEDLFAHCTGLKDTTDQRRMATRIDQLPFSAICDGIVDLITSTNETDETHCEQWPCVNQYTRCNRVWNCPKGTDEVNCKSIFDCPKDHHPCFFPKSETMGCLHIDYVDDGIVHCLGATDERSLCRTKRPGGYMYGYRCWNDSKCVGFYDRCNACTQLDDIDEICPESKYKTGDIRQYFRLMEDEYFGTKGLFSVQSVRAFPSKLLVSLNNKSNKHRTFPTIQHQKTSEFDRVYSLNNHQAWFCNRGILVYYSKNQTEKCFCPPSYHGNRCQYQSQRVSLTLRFVNENFDRFAVIGIIVTLIDNTGYIHSYEQLTYIPLHDCNTKHNIYLLYRDRPKNMTKNYTVHIDAYDKINLVYLKSWTLPVKLLFMPVNRLSAQLEIPSRDHCYVSCSLKARQQNKRSTGKVCQCQSKISKTDLIDQNRCDCSSDSLCVAIVNNRSICLCPLNKTSRRCLFNSICQQEMCMNDGLCVSHNDRISFTNFTCICQEGFSGRHCNKKDTQIDISFSGVSIPRTILAHFITIPKLDMSISFQKLIRATMFKKIGVDQEMITLFMALSFDILFAQIESKFYLTVLLHNDSSSERIITKITQSHHCPHIQHLFNKTILDYQILHRIKYYHIPCMEKSDLVCFHDNELFMCLCTNERHANCFQFDFNMTYSCARWNKCENQAQCFQDNPACPTKIMCVCQECFYGTLCQFTTEQFGLSLDAILGYQIAPSVSFHKQSIYVKISSFVASMMLTVGLISGVLSVLTFQSKACQIVGCGIYLLAASITSILTVICLNFKLWFLILSQMSVITSRSYLLLSCISTEYILRSLLAINDWYHAAVAMERLTAVILGVKFRLTMSKRVAKFLILIIPLFIISSLLHDPMHRHLIDDIEEQRTWCLIRLTSDLQRYNSFINLFFFIVPFSLKLIAVIGIVFLIANQRSVLKTQSTTYITNLKEQIQKHKYLIISSSLLVILATPRLILAFSSGCMKSAREPALFLIGYFVSFIPSTMTFFIFVITSKRYKQVFKLVIAKISRKLRRSLFRL